MNIKEISIEQLIPYKNNPRFNDDAVEYVKNSIVEFGFKVPIVVDANNIIVAGHTRLIAAQELGLATVPCIIADDLTEEQIKAFRLVDNRSSEFAKWDFDKLSLELQELDSLDMSAFGFADNEIDGAAVEIIEDDFNEDDALEEIKEPITKPGDVWQLGKHRIMCGSSTSLDDVKKLIGGVQSIDLAFTDPPYRLETKGGCKGITGESLKKQGESIEFISNFEPEEFLDTLQSVFGSKMNAYIFCNKELLPDYLKWAVANKYSYNVLVWKKPSGLPIADSHRPDIEYLLLFRKNAIWHNSLKNVNYSRCLEYSRVKKTEDNRMHPTIKPIELIANELLISSNDNGNVIDFFGGSGSTLIACQQTGRNCYMMELEPKYCDVIIKRWEKLTGEKAVLMND